MLQSGLPEQIADDENIVRFLIQSNHFSSNGVKAVAFLPNPKDRETSVSRHGREPSEKLWELGHSAAGTRTLYGAVIFKASVVHTALLELVAKEPPPHHAVIKGWPWIENDPEFQKAKQREIALMLASSAVMISYPNSSKVHP